MKIFSIHINDFHQFKDLHLDLTYPKGHEKEGSPLEKVCFIGQSGTGKTTLLNNILEATKKLKDTSMWAKPFHDKAFNEKPNFSIKSKTEVSFSFNNYNLVLYNGKFSENKNWNLSITDNKTKAELDSKKGQSIWKKIYNSTEHLIINYPADINIKHQFVSRKTPDKKFDDNKVVDFNYQKLTPIWSKVYKEVIDFQNEEANFRINLTKKAEVEPINIKEEISKWKKGTSNPLIKLANDCLNPIIKNFGLEIETDLPRIQNIDVIRAKSLLNNKNVPFESLSTGTKQIILTAIPLYELNTENSLVLVDEPEISLYPDIQQMIINYYTNLAPKAQFFFATHSPIIASSFEPWEIVELKFDYKKGIVFQEKYYENERHIDNYFINPQYLRWDSILTKVFDIKERGNEKRIEKMMELASLGKKIEKEKDKTKKVQIYQEYRKLAGLLDWETK
jgi:ABC-type lipoprotein export system ATPase subunit